MIRCSLYICLLYLSLFSDVNTEPLEGPGISTANIQQYLFVASLGRKDPNILSDREHFCTGALISQKHILTAAHCIEDEETSDIDVIIGEVDLRTASFSSAVYNIDSWITYVDWVVQNNQFVEFEEIDVAILTLSSMVDQGINPVSFTNLNAQQLHRTKALVVGWSLTNEIQSTYVLQKARVTILTPEECERKFKLIANRPIVIPKNYLCSWADPYALPECGDSGGPLLDENRALLGVTRSTSCASVNWDHLSPEFVNQYKVDIHMDINYYIDFIENVIQTKVRSA